MMAAFNHSTYRRNQSEKTELDGKTRPQQNVYLKSAYASTEEWRMLSMENQGLGRDIIHKQTMTTTAM
jgi:hypothetical protein